MTNAIRHEPGRTVTLAISFSCGQLRVNAHDTSCAKPVLADALAGAETGRGLMLVATLSDEWGSYRTAAAKAVYFTLACQPDPLPETADAARRGSYVGMVSHIPPAPHRPHQTASGSPHRDHLGAMVRSADSRAMSIRE